MRSTKTGIPKKKTQRRSNEAGGSVLILARIAD
jgi:hypothetical protein